MNKQLPLIAGGIVILVVIGIVAFLQMGKKGSSSSTAPTASSSAQNSSAVNSLKDLFASGKTTTCTFSYPDGSMSGTVYVSGNKVRNEFKTTTDGKTSDGTVIYDGTYAYFWSSSSSQAIKYKIDNIEDLQKQAQSSSQAMDTSKQANFNCSGWSADNSKFVPPSNIQFTDFTEMMMKATQSSSPAMGTSKNSMCVSISDPAAKAACEKYAQ